MATTKRFDVLVALVLALVLLAGCASSGSDKAGGSSTRKPLVLTLANPLGDSEEVDGFAAEVRRLSGGSIRIDVKSGWRHGQVDYEVGLIGDVRAGKADLGLAGSRAWDSVGVMSLRALDAPLLINSYALEDAVLGSSLTAQMLHGLAPLGLVGLGVLPGPLRRPIGVTRPLLGPGDYAGQRIGVVQSRVADATLRQLGATPVWIPVNARIAGLNGVEQATGNVEGDRYDKSVTVTSNVVLWPRPLVVFANGKTFTTLTNTQQRILELAAKDDLAPETGVVRNDDRISAANLCRSHLVRFVTATQAELGALRRAVQPVYAELHRDPHTGAAIAVIQAMGRHIPAEPATGCVSSAIPRAEKGPLDGVYQFTVTYSDLQGAGADPSELLPENVGKMTFVFDRGHFAATQEYPRGQACTWGYGTLTVKGDVLTQLFVEGGGIAPTGATNKPGELFTFKWSLYHDQLTLRRLPGTVSPTPDIAKPWLRITTAPSARYFSRRCPPPANALPG